ncbi:MAG: beta-lactamase family protein [Lunatimonas sp.]|uniref:serine hydrolase domain-containing protein n=1 Tax=Lunatimonas sp. TaxID=2060141 RepID=UPI00263BCE46|nr:serine hydrolase domain-containing protein [Lunatimonas sp.]MCC5936561.1 beta-lactamase family protein [Lunatimonas sp.]
MGFTKVENAIEASLGKTWRQFVTENALKEAVVQIHGDMGNDFLWTASSGSGKPTQPYFLGELSEMHFAAILLKLKARGKVAFNDPLRNYLPESLQVAINPWPKDRIFQQITVGHLLNHTSGLPDLLDARPDKKASLRELMMAGMDAIIPLEAYLKGVGSMKPLFSPLKTKKSTYSFTNTLLSQLLIEKITGRSLEAVLLELQHRPLGFMQTYLYTDHHDRTPSNFYHNQKKLSLPQIMSCLGYAGSMVSCASDHMTFIRAYFHGHLFPPEYTELTRQWIPVSGAISRGIGLEQYSQKRFFNLFSQEAPLLGMSSSTGAFALYHCEKKLFFTGTTNLFQQPEIARTLVWKLAKSLP